VAAALLDFSPETHRLTFEGLQKCQASASLNAATLGSAKETKI
jgi:hypothetical protein